MSIYQEKAKECICCGKHVPMPIILKEVIGIKVCPTTFSNIQEYVRIWKESGKKPSGNVRKHFSQYVQDIAEKIINEKNEKGD